MFDHRFAEEAASQHGADLRAAADRRRLARAAGATSLARRRPALALPRRRRRGGVARPARLQDC